MSLHAPPPDDYDQAGATCPACRSVILDQAPLAYFQTTPQGEVLAVNQATARLYGFDSVQELVSSVKNAGQVYADPGDRAVLLGLLEQHGAVSGFECLHKRKDGSDIWLSIHTQAFRNEQGRVAFHGFAVDVTAKKLADEALRKSGMFRMLVESALDGIRMLDREGRVTYVNRSMATRPGPGIFMVWPWKPMP